MRVALMVSCVVDLLRPSAARAAVRVLERSGCTVDVPLDQTCCGQPAWNAGHLRDARRVARNALRAFAGADSVVCLAGSCATMVRVFYRELFEGQPEQAAAADLAARTTEFSEYVAPLLDNERPLEGPGIPVVYHDSCHMLRELGIRAQPRRLLASAGCEVAEIGGSDRCCGFGGTFAVKLPEVSTAMCDEKLEEIRSRTPTMVVGCDVSCLVHMQGRARRTGMHTPFVHLAEVLDHRDDLIDRQGRAGPA